MIPVRSENGKWEVIDDEGESHIFETEAEAWAWINENEEP